MNTENTTLVDIQDMLCKQIDAAVAMTGIDADSAMEHVEEAQQLLTALRFRIWNTFHTSGERG